MSANEPIQVVLDIIVKNEFLINVRIVQRRRPSCSNNTNCDEQAQDLLLAALLLPPHTSVTELKMIIQERLLIDASEQRLSIDNKPIFYGPMINDNLINSQQQEQEGRRNTNNTKHEVITIQLKQVPLDPRVQNLLDITGYGDWQERDRVTHLMMQSRPPQRSWAGHVLTRLTHDDAAARQYYCTCCGHYFQKRERHLVFPLTCAEQCCPTTAAATAAAATTTTTRKPALCTFCLTHDQGRPAVIQPNDDPYQAIVNLAMKLARKMATVACEVNNANFGQWCDNHRMVSLDRDELEYANQLLLHQHGPGIAMFPDKQVLHAGVRLVVRFTQDVYQAAQAAGKWEALQKLQVDDEVYPTGVYCRDIMKIRTSIANNHELCNYSITTEFSNPLFQPVHDGQLPRPYNNIRLLSLTLEHAVFEIIVYTDDDDL